MGCSAQDFKDLMYLVKTDPDKITLKQSLAAIDSRYDAVARPFSVGHVRSQAGDNMMCAKILCVPDRPLAFCSGTSI